MTEKPNGGPAFPLQYDPYIDHPTHGRIHRKAVGEPIQEGMTLRDYFAAKALAGIIATVPYLKSIAFDDAADKSYLYADAMLKARNNG